MLEFRDAGAFVETGGPVEAAGTGEALASAGERPTSDGSNRVLFETMPQGVVYQDAEGRVTGANPAAERILGLSLAQMQGRTSMDPRWKAIRPDGSDFPGEEHPAMVALRTGSEIEGVVMGVFNPRDEAYRWILVRAVPLSSQGPWPTMVYTTFEDITVRKGIEDELRARTAELAERVKEVSCLYAIGRIVNDAGDLPLDTFLARIAHAIPHGLQRPDLAAVSVTVNGAMARTANFRDPAWTLTVAFRTGGGAVGELVAAYAERFWKDGEDPFLAEERDLLEAIGSRIGEAVGRRLADLERVRGETYYRELIENAQDLVAVINADGTLRFASPSHATITGFEPEELVGVSALAAIHPDDRAAVEEVLARGIDLERSAVRLQYRMRHRSGGWVAIEAIARNLLGNPAVQGFVVNGWDVSQRRQDEEIKALLREIDQRILEGVAVGALLELVCSRLVTLFELDLAWIGTTQTDGSIEIQARAGPALGYLDGFQARWDESPAAGPIGTALQSGNPVIVARDASREFGAWRTRARRYGLPSAAVLPLTSAGKPLGVLALYGRSPRTFAPEALERQAALASQIAISILHARHQEQIRLETAALEATASAMHITDRRGIIRWVNPAMERLTGYQQHELVGQSPGLLKSGVHGPAFYRYLWKTILEGRTWRGETHNRRKDGSIYVAEQTITPVRDASGSIVNFIAVQQDITERKDQDQRILHMAMHDPLTDLPNRRVLDEAVERALRAAVRGEPAALLLMDVDNFKAINDTVGHSAGDRFLLEMGELLARGIRPGDVLARFGGDEFAVLLQGATPEIAQNIAERLREAVGHIRFHENGYTFAPSVTIGIGVIANGENDSATVQALADSALHAGKEAGKNRVVVYQSLTQRESQMTTASQWATRIKDAIAENRLLLHYQPILRLADGRISHYEALVRMRDRNGELLMPGGFTVAAERFGLSPTIDRWVFDQVLDLLSERPGLRLAMNLSGASLGDEKLLADIADRVAAAGLGRDRLIIEITETAAVHNLMAAREWMARLQRLGCEFGLDDFGTGFSSFSSLRSLPVQHLKIDGSFVQLVDKDPPTRAIVRAMADLAHALDKQVVAEWVENDAQLNILRTMGIEFGQGFRWGVPRAEVGDMGVAGPV